MPDYVMSVGAKKAQAAEAHVAAARKTQLFK